MALARERVSWKDIEDMCADISSKIKRKKARPDLIVAVSRGGLVPARILSSYLRNRNLSVIRVKFYAGKGIKTKRPIIVEETTADVKGKTLLIVDDVLESGQTLALVKKYFDERGARKVHLAVLVRKNRKQKVRVDFFSRKSDKWIVYPWERFDGSDEE